MCLFLKKLNEMLITHTPQKTDPLNISLKTNTNEIKRISKDFYELYATLSVLKEKYITECAIAEDFISNYESLRTNVNLNEQPMYEEVIQRKLQFAKESEINYSKTVESVNSDREKFYIHLNSLLKKLRNIDRDLNHMFQHTLQKLQVILINKNEEETKEFQKDSNGINSIVFFSENKDLYLENQLKQVEFEPYILKILQHNENIKVSKEMDNKIQVNIYLHNVVARMKKQLSKVALKVSNINYLSILNISIM